MFTIPARRSKHSTGVGPMSDLRAMLGDRYQALATAISATVSDWLGHDTPYSPHGWRCEDKTRYPGPCGCDGEMAGGVMAVLGDVLPDMLTQWLWEATHNRKGETS